MRECLSIHIGQAGVQTGKIFPVLLLGLQHRITCDQNQVMHAGSCTVLNMEFSLMAKPPLIRPLGVAMTPLIPFFPRLALASMFPAPFSLILSPLCAMKSALAHTDSFITRSRLSPEKKMLRITTPVVITPSAKRLLTLFSTVSASLPITALVCRDS